MDATERAEREDDLSEGWFWDKFREDPAALAPGPAVLVQVHLWVDDASAGEDVPPPGPGHGG
jgi:hypothetical protein